MVDARSARFLKTARASVAQGASVALLTALSAAPLHAAPLITPACGATGSALQVLGSGGPEAADKRASSGYLIWQDARARLLIDAGGGVSLRFGEAGAAMRDLDAVVFTHFHADHASDFAALVKSSYFENRTRPLPVFGPPGNALMPGAVAFTDLLFGKSGAFRYLSDLTDGSGSYRLLPEDVRADGKLVRVGNIPALTLSATAVQHGPLPALAWRIETAGRVVVFSGDTSGKGELVALARGADIFVAHNAVPEGTTGAAHALHMTPDDIGRIAAAAKVKKLVLSHRMLRTLGREAETTAAIRKHYAGPVAFADDLDCYPLH
jgi:ribonuclease BN (tRNA processing enzyme)